MVDLTRRNVFWIAVPVVLLFFYLSLNSVIGDSPTMDEQNHLARGLAFLRTGDPRLSLEHPPLTNALSAAPLLLLPDIKLPIDHPSWDRPEGWYEFADLLLWQYNHDVTRMIFLARLPVLFITLGLALTGFHFARQMWGRTSALAAFILLLLEPNLLAHGRYATTDMGGTAFLFLATFLLWRLWQIESWAWDRWLLAGMGMGLAFGSKMSTLGFVPILATMSLLPVSDRLRDKPYWRAAGQRLAQLITAGLFSVMVLWVIYNFEWRPFQFQSDALLFLNQYSGPMPTFWAGVEQIAGFTGGGRGSAFLLGSFSDTGFPAYFPAAFLAKTPIPILIMLPLASLLLLRRKPQQKNALFLLVPALLYFLISTQSALNIGYRHLLPMMPFVLVLISGAAAFEVRKGERWAAAGRTGFGLTLLSVVASTLLIHPHYLSYFNTAAGGPTNGYNILVDSNIDWGQDLLRLDQWMDDNGAAEVNLAWFGSADPGYYGINYRPLPGIGRPQFFPLWWQVPFNRAKPEPGVYAISVTNLWELPLREDEKTVFAWFRAQEPDARVGYSILIYEVE